MTIEEFGASLREERERKGITLDDVANRLKISVRMLRAFEEGSTEVFPHIAYVKGFIRSYAAFLGFSAEEIAEAVKVFDPLARDSEAYIPVEAQPTPNQTSSLVLPFGILLLVLGLLAGGGYYLWSSGLFATAYDWVMEKSKSLTKSEKKDDETRKSAPLSGSRDDVPLALKEKKDEPRDNAERMLEVPAQQKDLVKPEPVPDFSPKPLPQDSSSAAQTGPQQVLITATEACWIHSTADSTDTRQFSLRKGETFALTFRDRLELKLGNAGGVRFRFNGEDLPPFGKPGQVKTVIFPSKEVL